MLRKLVAVAVMVAGVLAMAVPGEAATTSTARHASLKAPKAHKAGATSTLAYDSARKVWNGRVDVAAGALPPGTYSYTVVFTHVKINGGIAPGIGDFICSLKVNSHQSATHCTGKSKNLTPGIYGTRNYAEVSVGGELALQGIFKR